MRRFASGLDAGAALAAVLWLAPAARGDADLPPPERVLGFDPTAGGALIDPEQLEAYWKAVAAASPLVRLEALGLSVEGRPIWAAFVSSSGNMARLGDVIRRGTLPVALVTFGVHPLEVGSTLAAPAFLHRLVAGKGARSSEVLAGAVVCIVPAVNPDGTARAARWLRGPGKGTGRAPFIQHRFAGHDLNRDWVAATQPETSALLEVVHVPCRPWLTVDVHQMASTGPRFFVPPYAEPIHPALPADLLGHAGILGERVLAALTGRGRRGGANRWLYDAWSPSRCYPFYHGGIRFLVEVASARFAEPLDVAAGSLQHPREGPGRYPAPWSGGRWGIPDVTGVMVDAAEEAVGGLLDEPLRSAFRARSETPRDRPIEIDARGADPAVAAALLRYLEASGGRVAETEHGWLASDPAHGRGWCRALLTCAEYPAGSRSAAYDTTSSDLAHLAGLLAAPARDGTAPREGPGQQPASRRRRFLRPGRLAGGAGTGEGAAPERRWVVSQGSLAIFAEIADLAERGIRLERVASPLDAGGISFAPGDFIVTGATRAWLEHAALLGAHAAPLDHLPGGGAAARGLTFLPPSVRVLEGEPSEDEGWLRWVLEEHGFRFRSAREIVPELEARPFDVPGPFGSGSSGPRGGRPVLLVPEGVLAAPWEAAGDALHSFVRGGGRVIAIGKSSRDLASCARLALREKGERRPALPGTLLRSVSGAPRGGEPLLWGYSAPPGVFYTGGPVWDVEGERQDGVEPILLVHGERPGLCGLLDPGDEAIVKGGAALVRIREGDRGGEWILFGFSPHFRAWALGTYRLLFNAILAP